jgi:hypothetical protein
MIMAVCLTLAALLPGVWAQEPSQSDRPPQSTAKPAATATVRGRVIAAATGQPLHRVRITMAGSVSNPPTAVTDTRGRFEVTDVPPGTYSITAVRAGYLTIQYGQRRPREAGRTLSVSSGQTIEGVDFALPRGSVLAGRITDELGDPASGARVEAIELRYIRGRRVAVAAKITNTNDAGEYRLSGLDPGAYQIRASITEVWEGDDGKETYVYAITSFPGVTSADQPQSINVPLGQEVSGLDFRLIPGRAARITGIVEDANGTPMAAQVVNLDRITRTVGGALLSAGFGGTTKTDARGAFEISKLAPGEYQAYSGGPNDRTSVPVILNDGDVKHVVLTPRKPTGIAGSIVTDDRTVPTFPAARIGILPVATDAESLLPTWGEPRTQPPRPDWTFRVVNMDGHYLVRVTGLPDDWMLKSVLLGGRDVTDTPLAIARGGADVEGLQIVLSRKGATVSGDVVDSSGAPGADATVLLFAENRSLWGVASRFIRAVRPNDRGRFSIRGLPPAVYRAIASDAVIEGQWEDPEFLQSLMKGAARVELADGAAETITLKMDVQR